MYAFEYMWILLVLSVSIWSRQITGSSYCNPPQGYPKFWRCNGETATLDKEGYQKVTLLKIHGIYGIISLVLTIIKNKNIFLLRYLRGEVFLER